MKRTALKRSISQLKRTRISPISKSPRATLMRKCNGLWGLAIHLLGRERCALCGHQGMDLHASHLVGKGANPYIRHELLNGLLLCARHHRAMDGQRGREVQMYTEGAIWDKYPLRKTWADRHRHDRRRRIPLEEVETELREAIRRVKNNLAKK